MPDKRPRPQSADELRQQQKEKDQMLVSRIQKREEEATRIDPKLQGPSDSDFGAAVTAFCAFCKSQSQEREQSGKGDFEFFSDDKNLIITFFEYDAPQNEVFRFVFKFYPPLTPYGGYVSLVNFNVTDKLDPCRRIPNFNIKYDSTPMDKYDNNDRTSILKSIMFTTPSTIENFSDVPEETPTRRFFLDKRSDMATLEECISKVINPPTQTLSVTLAFKTFKLGCNT